MRNGIRLLILVAGVLLGEPFVAAKKYNVTVGYLPCIMGEVRHKQGLTISGAISMALEDINKRTDLLPDVNLLLKWNDTKCNTAIAIRLMTDMRSSGVVAFFGPEGRCRSEGIITESRNLPVISYKCSDYQPSTLPNFAQLNPPETQTTKSVISLLRYYRWNKFSILYEESWATVAMTLKNHAKNKNMTVIHQRLVTDSFKCCAENMECCELNPWNKLIQETKTNTRIYVILGSTSSLIELMTAMESLQLFENGEYMVVFVDMILYSSRESEDYLIKPEDRRSPLACSNTPDFRKRAQSLLVIVSSKPESSYEHFTSRVRKYCSMEPFKFPVPTLINYKFITFVSIYAAYLYDSVKLYATALHSLIEEDTRHRNETLTYEKLMSVATNGSRIVSRMITNTPFKSVSGMSISLDERGDSGGNYSLLAFKPINFNDKDFNCSNSMVSVAQFQQSTKEFPEYKLNPLLPIDWANGVKPEDEPLCGFHNDNCPKDNSQIALHVVTGIITVTLFCGVTYFLLKFIITKRINERRKTHKYHRGPTEKMFVIE